MEKDKILIVEDEKDTRFILSKLLSKNGYDAIVAKNGAEALELLNDFLPKVILADWTMPIMDGVELCNRVKSDPAKKLIYYIILTARTSLNDRIKGLDLGADDFLLKPIENQELLARIRTGVRIHNLQNELRNIERAKVSVEMACAIGHEMNNPLSSLIISFKNIEEELEKGKSNSLDEDLTIVRKSVERIKFLVNNLVGLNNADVVDYTPNQKMIKLS